MHDSFRSIQSAPQLYTAPWAVPQLPTGATARLPPGQETLGRPQSMSQLLYEASRGAPQQQGSPPSYEPQRGMTQEGSPPSYEPYRGMTQPGSPPSYDPQRGMTPGLQGSQGPQSTIQRSRNLSSGRLHIPEASLGQPAMQQPMHEAAQSAVQLSAPQGTAQQSQNASRPTTMCTGGRVTPPNISPIPLPSTSPGPGRESELQNT